jgi:hypothetical protein
MNEKIEEIKNELNDDSSQRLQDFINFRAKERVAIQELEKLLGISRALAIAVACKYMVEEAKKSETKQNGKK